MTIQKLQRNVASVIQNIDEIVLRAAMLNENYIVDLNTSQLSEGKTSKGNPITPEYFSSFYAKYKKSIGAKPAEGTPDLKVSGDFYSGFFVKKERGWLELHSSDWKEGLLTAKYADIMGLNTNSLKELKPYILPDTQKLIKDEIRKN